MLKRIFCVLALTGCVAAQPWSGILDSSRAIDWSTVPGYNPTTVEANWTACSTPSLSAGSANANANTTAIQNAILTCDTLNDGTHTKHIVNLPAGTYYVSGGPDWQGRSYVVVRGQGASGTGTYTTLITNGLTNGSTGCGGYGGTEGWCMSGGSTYAQAAYVNPGSTGNSACTWTGTITGGNGTYTKGDTTIFLNNCWTTLPAVGDIIGLDQANDGATDTLGIYVCSGTTGCNQNGGSSPKGRVIGGVLYSEEQLTQIQSISGIGSGPYTVTISPGVYFNNIRSSQSPGAWWSQTPNIHNDGIENLTYDFTGNTQGRIANVMIWCVDCWVKNLRSLTGASQHIYTLTSYGSIIRDSYFYGWVSQGSESYTLQYELVSNSLTENNIMQNTTSPDIKDSVSGSVSDYNFTPFINFGGDFEQGLYASHNAGSGYNLLEGNVTADIFGDDVWGSSCCVTMFRNMPTGWQNTAYYQQDIPVDLNSWVRGVNIIGNVLGQPGYHLYYQTYATSTTGGLTQTLHGGSTVTGTNTNNGNFSIYELGWGDSGGVPPFGNCGGAVPCDSRVFTSLMRWKNYDTVNNAIISDNTEASPGAIPYLNANPVPTSALPNSFIYNSKPNFFGTSDGWPAIGSGVTSGTLGNCNGGTYAGMLATSSGQCTGSGATFSANTRAGLVNVIPSVRCYYSLGGPPDGSGAALPFDANACYSAVSGPQLSVTPSSANYGSQVINTTSAAQTFTVQNTGTASATLSSVTVSGAAFSISSQTCGASLGAGTSCTVSITFRPTSTGAASGTLTVVDTPDSITVTSSLSGTGINSAPVLGISPSSLSFPNQNINTTSSGQTLTLSNTGTATATISSIAYSGTNASYFSTLSTTCGATLAASANCVINVAFTPAAVGSASATVTVTDTPDSLSVSSALSGNGVNPNAPTLVSFNFCQDGSFPASAPLGTCTQTSNIAAGSTIIVAFATYNNAGTTGVLKSVTDGGSNPYTKVAGARSTSGLSGSGYWNEIWYSPNIQTATNTISFTPSVAVSDADVCVWAASKVTMVNQAGAISPVSSNATTTPSGPALTTTSAPGFLVSLMHPVPGTGLTGVNTGNPFVGDNSKDNMGCGHLITSALGTSQPQWLMTTSGSFAASTVAFVGPATFTPTMLPTLTNTQVVNQTLTGNNFNGTVSWSVTNGALPTGLTIASSGTNTALISGTISAAGTYSFTIQASDGVNIVDMTFSNVLVNVAPTITTTSMPSGSLGVAYSKTLLTSGGTGAVICSITSGTLPPGISFNGPSCTFSGTPTVVGNYPLGVTPIDANGVSGQLQSLSITVLGTCAITPTSVGPFRARATVNVSFSETGCNASTFTLSVSGSLSGSGLTLGSNGVLSGVAVQGTFSINVLYDTASDPITFTILPSIIPATTNGRGTTGGRIRH